MSPEEFRGYAKSKMETILDRVDAVSAHREADLSRIADLERRVNIVTGMGIAIGALAWLPDVLRLLTA